MAKIWQQFGFWMKIRAAIGTLGAGGEITLLATEQAAYWHWITIGATALGMLITLFIEDKNNNNIVDLFENQTKKNGEA